MAQSVEEPNDKGKTFSVGPYGGTEGRAWDDGIYSTVKTVMICHDAFCIRWIRIQYVFAGRLFWSEIHGPTNYNDHIHTVDLDDYPDEFLIEMSGRYVKSSWLLPTSLASLAFKSNKKVYGPFGILNKGHSFSIQVPGSMIVGFHGRYNVWHSLPAIGAHLKPIETTTQKVNQLHKFQIQRHLHHIIISSRKQTNINLLISTFLVMRL